MWTLMSTETVKLLYTNIIVLKDSDARIIIGSFSEETARKVFCEVNSLIVINYLDNYLIT